MRSMRPETGVQPQHAGEQHDQQQAPPEDRHRVAGERRAHQRLVERRAALDRREDAGRDAEQRRAKSMAQSDSSSVAGKSVGNSLQDRLVGEIETPKSPCSTLPDIVEELLPARLVEAELVRSNWRAARASMPRSPASTSTGRPAPAGSG